MDSQGNVIVADSLNHMVEALLPNGRALTYGHPTGQCGMSNPQPDTPPGVPPVQLPFNAGCFGEPRSVAVDSSDLIYVVDWANNSFVVFDSVANTPAAATELVPLARFGTTGGPDWNPGQTIGAIGELEAPVAIAVDRGLGRYNNTARMDAANNIAGVNRVFVLDQQNNRIQAWDCNAASLRSADAATAANGCVAKGAVIGAPDPANPDLPAPGYFAYPWGFGVDQTTGDIAVAEYGISMVDVYRYPFGSTFPWGYVTSIGTLVPSQNFDPTAPGNITNPEDVKFIPGATPNVSDLWVTDYGNNRVQVFQQNGNTVPTLRNQPLTGAGLRYQTTHGSGSLELNGPQALEFHPTSNRVIVVDQGNNRLVEWAAAGLTVTTSLPANLVVGSVTATVTVTNSGTVPLSNVVAIFDEKKNSAVGVAVDHSGGQWPPTAVSLAPGSSTAFPLPLSILVQGAVSLQPSASAVHQFSGATITATGPVASGTSALAPNPKVTSSATATPNPVLHGAVICVKVTANNGGNRTLVSPTLSIVPDNATPIPAASAPASCPANAFVGTTTLAVPPATPSSTTWTEPFTAGSTGVATFVVSVSATVQGTSQVVNAVNATVQTTISPDVTAPTIAMTVAPKFPGPGVETAANAAGWWNTLLLAKFHATDDTALANICYTVAPTVPDVQNGCIDVTANPQFCNASRTVCDYQLTLDYSNRYSITYSATDAANNTFTKSTPVNLDMNPPTVDFTNPTPAANSHGWNNTSITWNIVPVDTLSGVATMTFGGTTLSKPQITINSQGSGVQATVVITDIAGNTAAYSSPPKNIDFIQPTMTPLVTGNIVTFPIAGSSFPNGQMDPAPSAVTLPPGITVGAFKSSDIDPATAPPAAGLPADGPQHTWTICDNAGNCNTIGFGAELVNAFDLTLRDDATYTRYGSTGHLAPPLTGVCLGGVKRNDHDGDADDDDCLLAAIYSVVDANGNGIYLMEQLQHSEGTEVDVTVLGFSYVSGCPAACSVKLGVVPKNTKKHFQWTVDKKTGNLTMLDQEMWIGDGGDGIHVTAHYDAKKNTTIVQRDGKSGFKSTLTGLALLDMATAKGALTLEYGGTVIAK